MKHIMMLTIVALFGCAPQADKICETDVVGLAMGFEQLDCQRLDYNLRFARRLMIENGMTRQEWDKRTSRLTIVVMDVEHIRNPYGIGDGVSGFTNLVTEEVVLTKSMLALMHELFHVRKQLSDGLFHEGWDTDGTNTVVDYFEHNYFGADDEFEKCVEHDKKFQDKEWSWLDAWYYEEVGWPKQN